MARNAAARIQTAAEPVLVEGERITGFGQCWGAQMRGRTPLFFRARRQYLMALTDRRLLVFERKRKPTARDLVLGKRYEAFTLERVRRRRPLLQIMVNANNGTRMAFEFRPGQRDIGGELVARLTPKNGAAKTAPAPEAPAAESEPAPMAATTATTTDAPDPDANVNLPERLGLPPLPAREPAPAAASADEPEPAPEPDPAPDPAPAPDPERSESDAFWGRK